MVRIGFCVSLLLIAVPACNEGERCAGAKCGQSQGSLPDASTRPAVCGTAAITAQGAHEGNNGGSTCGGVEMTCTCRSAQTCVGGYNSSLSPYHCGFCFDNVDTRFATLCGAGAGNTPNYCPTGTRCFAPGLDPNSAIRYGCCPDGMTCDHVKGYGACATDAGN